MSEPVLWCPECERTALPVCDLRNHPVIDLVAVYEGAKGLMDYPMYPITRVRVRHYLAGPLGMEAERAEP